MTILIDTYSYVSAKSVNGKIYSAWKIYNNDDSYYWRLCEEIPDKCVYPFVNKTEYSTALNALSIIDLL